MIKEGTYRNVSRETWELSTDVTPRQASAWTD
jgi:hypothetical protein